MNSILIAFLLLQFSPLANARILPINEESFGDFDNKFKLDPSKKSIKYHLSPDEIRIRELEGSTQINVYTKIDESLQLIAKLPFQIPGNCIPGESLKVKGELRSRYIKVIKDQVYFIEMEVKCSSLTELIFESTSDAGQVLSIWNIGQKAVEKLSSINRIDFWKRQIAFEWPGFGDYYLGGSVYISRGDHWDSVGHELGHAIYDMAGIGVFGRGSHRVDECYSQELALSEGWASFFSAWLSIDLADPEAKFEFVVPRRAPIHIENIPSDVCKGSANEWRVISFLWDLIDTHEDNETTQLSFEHLWDLSFGADFKKIEDFKALLIKNVDDEKLITTPWINNL